MQTTDVMSLFICVFLFSTEASEMFVCLFVKFVSNVDCVQLYIFYVFVLL